MCSLALVGIWRNLRKVRSGGKVDPAEADRIMLTGGVLGRCFRRVYSFIDAAWKMYSLGLLFGLGFDTATEVSLLAVSAANTSTGMSIGLVMFLPALFTAGMTLVDTADGIMMTTVFLWATIHPVQKLYYNFTITPMSVVIAFVICLIQVLGIFSKEFGLYSGIHQRELRNRRIRRYRGIRVCYVGQCGDLHVLRLSNRE
ncbi:high-affinity nickel-transport protein-domain-containing protein [Fimicolochytrium jonesii]|uniref:high-affinity nickel-transport protein-domain-containing protein n=1 Tax=Fimicolochytrium jonesii TaxID=1396493 RepID=UPI0022FDD679|nr:high-affinity nickel-transport protein-domain-containing protein [Fimicolochytrium jonesii]KAI8819199.1 high-affinity nickel-transport protein-domain-containing protein [Fimicolochytrium jonesii]